MSDGQILRTGVLFKKGSGTGPFGRKNWKPRYFVLTPSRLQYFTFEDGELKGELSLQGCDEGVLEVMPADSMKTGSSASTIWRVAINAPERRLLVAAGTEMEMNDWVDKLVLAFRINSGQQPLQRASMPATSFTTSSNSNSNTSIRDFQNFSVPRRGMNQRYSVGAEVRPSSALKEHEVQMQTESLKQQQVEAQRRQKEEQERQVEQDAEMRRHLAAQQQRQAAAEEEEEEAAQAAALAAAQELQRQEEQEKVEQKEREVQKARAIEKQQALERRQEEEAARIQNEHEQEVIQNERLAHELAMQEKLKAQQSDDLLESQRRQKREEHARQRAEREQAIKLKMQHEFEQKEKHLTHQLNSQLESGNESDTKDELDRGPNGQDAVPNFASQVPSPAPRSSLVGDVKREMIQKQQLEHQRRREAALKQEQQARDAELEHQRAKMEALDVREAPREVEVAPREIEIVRRAPAKKIIPNADPMASFEF